MQEKPSIKTFTTKKGTVVRFRYLRRSDIRAALAFINALIAEDTYIGIYGKPLTYTEEKRYIEGQLKEIIKGEQSHVVVEVNGQFVGSGGVRREWLRRKKHVGSFHIALLAPYRDEGIGTELVKTLIEEARRMKIRVVGLTCFENNARAIHIYEKTGFKSIGTIPEAIFYKESYIGEVMMYLSLVK
jgi:RimJ/RimL family protein N-acetyltransferase